MHIGVDAHMANGHGHQGAEVIAGPPLFKQRIGRMVDDLVGDEMLDPLGDGHVARVEIPLEVIIGVGGPFHIAIAVVGIDHILNDPCVDGLELIVGVRLRRVHWPECRQWRCPSPHSL